MPLYRLRYLASRRSPTQYRSVSGRYWSRGWIDLETRDFIGKSVDDTLYLLPEAAKAVAQVTPPDDLVLELAFFEGSGTTAHDSSKYGNHGTIYGAVWQEKDGVMALYFDGVDDYVEVPDSPELNPSYITIVVLLKVFEPMSGKLVSKWGEPYGSGGYLLQLLSDGNLRFAIGDGSVKKFDTTYRIKANEWYIIHAVHDGTMKIYINGMQDPNTLSAAAIQTISYNLYIGRNVAESEPLDKPTHGLFAFVQILNRGLTETEIQNQVVAVKQVLTLGEVIT